MNKLWSSLALALCASLQGCFLLKNQAPDASDSPPDLTPLVETFARCFGGNVTACDESVSYPIYIDGKALSANEFLEELPDDGGDRPLPEFSLQYRVQPLSELGFYWPQAWQTLQTQPNFAAESPHMRTLAVNLFAPDEPRPEMLIFLIKKTPAGWRISGFNDG